MAERDVERPAIERLALFMAQRLITLDLAEWALISWEIDRLYAASDEPAEMQQLVEFRAELSLLAVPDKPRQ